MEAVKVAHFLHSLSQGCAQVSVQRLLLRGEICQWLVKGRITF
uniref:Uncharacterized protein n=1 Tax=Anguilla anguilla TaxID=7936 RepID=A0A0E9RK21_ANGAN